MINKERMELWIQALESDEHQQCRGMLRKPAQENEYLIKFDDGPTHRILAHPEMHCALGIGVLVALQHGIGQSDNQGRWVWDWSDLPPQVQRFYGLESANPQVTINERRNSILGHNDDAGHSFWTIAQAMRAEFLKDES